MHRHVFGATFAAVLLFASACSDSPSEPEVQPDPVSNLTCTAPALAVSEANPFDRVEVTGIAGIDEDAWVEFETASGTRGITPVIINDAGKAEIVVPPNPDDLVNGGTMTLAVTDGIGTCAPMTINVRDIEAVAGNPLVETVAALDALTALLAAQFGLDPATVAATSLDALPPHAVPLALLLEAREAFDPATVLDGLTTSETTFVQSMIASFGRGAMFSDLASSIDAPALDEWLRPVPATPTGAARREGCTDLGTVPAGVFDLGTPQKLSDRMKDARAASAAGGPLAQAIGDYGAAFAVMGLAVPQVGAVAGWLAFGAQLVQKMVSGLYPSAITRLEFQIDKDRIEEDWDASRGDPPIKWNFAKVWATNNGMGLARVGLDLITTAAALPSGFAGKVGKTAIGGLDIIGKEALNKRLDELEKEQDQECWGIGATEFGPVVIDDDTGEQWVTAEILTGDAISVGTPDIRTVEARKIGTATLRVKTQSEPFPGPFGFEDKQVEVVRKEVVWIPRTLLVENPGETVTVKFRVDDSKHNGAEDIQLTPGPNLPPLTPTFSGGVHTIEFQTSDDPEHYPTWIEVCSTSKELEPSEPDRCTRIEIYADERVKIEQKDVCVGSGETEPFTATASGPGDVVVRWEIESGAGDLSSNEGLTVDYIAPSSGSGEVTLRAYLSSNTEVEDRITFRYGACSGLAVYYANAVEIGFPFGVGGSCNNPDLSVDFEELTFPEEGLLPEVAPAPGDIWVGRTQRFTHQLEDSGNFGDIPQGSDVCDFGFFSADASYDGTLTGSDDGTRLDIDITTMARSNAEVVADRSEASTAFAAMFLAGRFDFDLTSAANYRLKVNLSCDTFVFPGLPPLSGMLSIIAVQLRPDGSYAPVNATTQPIQVQCQPGVPLVIDQLLQFSAPADGAQDHVMLMFQIDNIAGAALPTDSGTVNRTGYLRGFISVERE